MCHSHILGAEDAKQFITAGKAFFTVENENTGNRLTFKVSHKKENLSYVYVLTGSDNTSWECYTYLGTLWDNDLGTYRHSRKSRIGTDAMSAKTFAWLAKLLSGGHEFPDGVNFWHDGRCGRCGRPLSVPSSIQLGLGPICADKAGAGHRFIWTAQLPTGDTVECRGGSENSARSDLRDQLGCGRLPNGTVFTRAGEDAGFESATD